MLCLRRYFPGYSCRVVDFSLIIDSEPLTIVTTTVILPLFFGTFQGAATVIGQANDSSNQTGVSPYLFSGIVSNPLVVNNMLFFYLTPIIEGLWPMTLYLLSYRITVSR